MYLAHNGMHSQSCVKIQIQSCDDASCNAEDVVHCIPVIVCVVYQSLVYNHFCP